MTDSASTVGASKDATRSLDDETARWPLAYKLQPQAAEGLAAFGVASSKSTPKKRWWSHQLYRGPNNERVKILYSKSKADSEELAQPFLKEKVVGFDMEWPWDDWRQPNRLQNKIGLIQVATEDRIALFHLGLHPGKTTDDIIAPSLRKLIESPNIGKIGVGICSADFARLSKYFELKPKAAVELSHLHRLVTFGGRKPELVSTKMTSLAQQVEQHLEHPLYKGDVRTSNWSKPLSQEQIKYAAGDAYAGIMLYHCLNYKRLKMKPTPPLPIHAEKYVGYKLDGISSLYLEPLEPDGKIMTSAFFFGVPTAPEDLSRSKRTAKSSATTLTKAKGEEKATVRRAVVNADASGLDATSKALLEELQIRRKAFAAETNLPEYRIASNQTLMSLAQDRPVSSDALLKIKGIGPLNQKRYGNGWLETISSFMAKHGPVDASGMRPETARAPAHSTEITEAPSTPTRGSRRRMAVQSETPDSSPAFGTPPQPRTAQLHTGLSFTMAETKIASECSSAEDSGSSLPSLDSGKSPSRRSSGQKRKRIESPTKQDGLNSSQRLQQMIRNYQYEEGVSESQGLKTSAKTPKEKTGQLVPPTDGTTVGAPLTPRSKIFRNKLLALSRLVATKKQADAGQLVSAETLELIARKPPRTHEELRHVPGIQNLFDACVDVKMDLLEKIHKFAPARDQDVAA